MKQVNKYLSLLIYSPISLIAALAFTTALPAAHAFDLSFGKGGESNAKCFLSGTVRPINDNDSKKGFQTMENNIRMNFDANDAQTCERYLRSYCQNNILGRGDVPLKLTAYFRPSREIASEEDKKPTHTYEITEGCKLIID